MLTIILLVFEITTVPDYTILPILSLCGAVILALIYRIVAATQTIASRNLSPSGTNENFAPQTESIDSKLFRFSVAGLAVGLGGFGLALILAKYSLLDDFLLIFPLTAFFPFSYLAYIAFQRDLRIKRLKLDFDLLGLKWDEGLAQQSQGFWNFALHIILAMMITIMGLSLFAANGEDFSISTVLGTLTINEATLKALQYGFIGSYLFAVQLVYRRYTTYDLHPTVYMYSALTMLAGLIFNYVAFEGIHSLVGSNAAQETGLGPGLEAILAFALGFFPLLAIQWMGRIVTNVLGTRSSRSDELPLSLLDGISTLHETRLRDHGIDNLQNLAAVDLPFLLINSTFNTQEVLDWVDQACLYLHLEQGEIQNFRQARIRTISDFREIWKPFYQLKPTANDDTVTKARTDKAKLLGTNVTPEQLDLLYQATNSGPNLHYIIHYWKNADFRRRIDYLNDVSNQFSPQLCNALALTFLAGRYDSPDPVIGEEVIKNLGLIWNEIDHYPIKDEEKIPSKYSLAKAGLAALKQWQAHNPNKTVDSKTAVDEDKIRLLKEALGNAEVALKSHDEVRETILQLIDNLSGEINPPPVIQNWGIQEAKPEAIKETDIEE
ncbi:MAG: hypothetical protein K8L97_10040 [Anaerolineae bacterium]|nr:hypothetical protein [Anaerolineae bacterium]